LISDYARLLVWPARLSAFHVFHASKSLAEPKVLAGVAILVIYAAVWQMVWKRSAPAGFALLWTGITLAPVLNARWMAANVLTERYLYLPSVGFCWFAAWVGVTLWQHLASKASLKGLVTASGLCVLLTLCAAGAVHAYHRNRVWADDVTLYTRTLASDPDSFVMHLNLGVCFYVQRQPALAEREYKKGLELKPDSVNLLNALGVLYLDQGRYAEAAALFEKAIGLRPLWGDAHFNYARVLETQGDHAGAVAEYRVAVDVAPMNAEAHRFYAESLLRSGDIAQAEAQFETAKELGASWESLRELIDLYLETGRTESAENALRQLLEDFPFDAQGHLTLAGILESSGRIVEAQKEYFAVLAADPQNAEAKAALARIRKF
jgi:Tfp pilus assembly protein PilF